MNKGKGYGFSNPFPIYKRRIGMNKVLELQKLPIDSEIQPQVGPTITIITVIPTTFVSFISVYCDNHVS